MDNVGHRCCRACPMCRSRSHGPLHPLLPIGASGTWQGGPNTAGPGNCRGSKCTVLDENVDITGSGPVAGLFRLDLPEVVGGKRFQIKM